MLRGNGRGTKLVVAGDIGVLSQGCKGIVIADLEVVSENRREPSAG